MVSKKLRSAAAEASSWILLNKFRNLHQPQIPIQAPIQPLQPGNTNNSNYTINRLPELKKVNVGVKKEQSEELESPSDKSKISFANILN